MTSCAPVSTALDPSIVVSQRKPNQWPSAANAPAESPPQIERIWLSGLQLHEGSSIDGAIATTTNVASVEVRTATFSINCPRTTFGQFTFKLNVLVFPPLLKRTYPLQIIARNTAGVATTRTAYLSIQ